MDGSNDFGIRNVLGEQLIIDDIVLAACANAERKDIEDKRFISGTQDKSEQETTHENEDIQMKRLPEPSSSSFLHSGISENMLP